MEKAKKKIGFLKVEIQASREYWRHLHMFWNFTVFASPLNAKAIPRTPVTICLKNFFFSQETPQSLDITTDGQY